MNEVKEMEGRSVERWYLALTKSSPLEARRKVLLWIVASMGRAKAGIAI